MSWIQELAGFAKRLLLLETRVSDNSDEIKELRKELKALTEFTQKVAYAVKRNQAVSEDKQTILVKSLENELLKLENRLLGSRTNESIQRSSDEEHDVPE